MVVCPMGTPGEPAEEGRDMSEAAAGRSIRESEASDLLRLCLFARGELLLSAFEVLSHPSDTNEEPCG